MVKILYGIQGDGMGHALRSRPTVEHLLKQGHKVKIVSSNKAYSFLKDHFKNVEEIYIPSWYYRNNKVSYIMTGVSFLMNLPKMISKGFMKVSRIIKEFKPEIIITDFDVNTAKLAAKYKIPCISIDNIQMLRVGKVPLCLSTLIPYCTAKRGCIGIVPSADYFLITSFFNLELLDKYKTGKYEGRVKIVPSIIRDSLIEIRKKAKYKDHIIVYQTAFTNKNLIPELKKVKGQKFYVYGWPAEGKDENVTFRKFSDTDFINDLASAKAVITNGGYTLMSEAVFLHKPIFSCPLHGQYEQRLNGEMLEKVGYGMLSEETTADKINEFIKKIPTYRKNLEKYKQVDNSELFKEVDKIIKEIK
jgi:uncharacterized protein (TIGR00661 family)